MSDRVLDVVARRPQPESPAATPGRPAGASVLEPPTGRTLDGLRVAWQRRGLTRLFAHRALQKIYARTFLGRTWLALRPGLDATLRIAVLGTLIGAAVPGVPYAVFAAVGLTAWQTFEVGGYWATRSLETNRRILRRAALPRLPMVVGSLAPSQLFAGLYGVGTLILLAVYWLADGELYLVLGPRVLEAVAGVAMIAACAVALGLWLAPLAVRYRDVRFTVSLVLGLWFFLTPVIYPLSHVHGALHAIATWNPLTPPIMLVQQGLLGTPGPATAPLVVSVVALGALLAGGVVRFLQAEARAVGAA